MPNRSTSLLSTKELPQITGLSASFFEKGRIYGYGPRFIRIQSAAKAGRVLYRREDVESWLVAQSCTPGAVRHGQ